MQELLRVTWKVLAGPRVNTLEREKRNNLFGVVALCTLLCITCVSFLFRCVAMRLCSSEAMIAGSCGYMIRFKCIPVKCLY